MRFVHILLAAFSTLAVLLGGWSAVQEANQYVFAGLDGPARLGALLDKELVPGLSVAANKTYAEICMETVVRLDARMLAAPQQQKLHDACLSKVQMLAAQSPVSSFLWLAQAQLAFQARDFDALSDGLVQSVASGPNEYWIAARRFDLGERSLANLSPDAAQAHELNMAFLAGTAQGNRLLAARYVLVPEFRQRATALIEGQPAEQQHIFLLNVEHFTDLRRASP